MNFDKSKFVAREGDSEGFTVLDANGSYPAVVDLQLANAHIDEHPTDFDYRLQAKQALAEHFLNPKGWQEVEGVRLPNINWADFDKLADGRPVPAQADYAAIEGRVINWAQLDDAVLEETFQAWLRTSTRPENVVDFRKRLRQRISEMVQQGWKCDPATVIDLTGLK